MAGDELDGASAANEVTIETASARLRKPDPWKDYDAVRQGLKSSVLRALGVADGK